MIGGITDTELRYTTRYSYLPYLSYLVQVPVPVWYSTWYQYRYRGTIRGTTGTVPYHGLVIQRGWCIYIVVSAGQRGQRRSAAMLCEQMYKQIQ